jgi:hypothetical protein
MNLICFPHYTCGGLFCDILSGKFSDTNSNGGLISFNHSLGKIGDADTVFVDYDPALLISTIQQISSDDINWVGTHCWPGRLDLTLFDQIINITTTTFKSKLYRWCRAYHLYYYNSDPWAEVKNQARIDKERETAKNYLIPFEPVIGTNVTNIEFAEVVENSQEFQSLMSPHNSDAHLTRWRNVNKFLYNQNIWNSTAFQRFYEAELEVHLKKYYVYQ